MRIEAKFICMLALGAALPGACSGEDSSQEVADAGMSTAVDAAISSDNGCGAKVTIVFYRDADCTPGMEAGMRVYDTAQTCFSWVAAGSSAQENSATRFQCYRDRICYTQHPNVLTCDGAGQTDKEARTDTCLKEPAGSLYSKVLRGTESCPEAPAGFSCPASAAQQGTSGIVACGG